MSSSGEISYVVLGGCADGSGGTRVSHDRCALSPEFCPNGDDFVSADQLVVGVNHPTCDGVPSATVGRCGDTNRCSATASGCKNPNTFKQDNTCSVLQDKTTLPTIQALFNDNNGGGAPLTYYTACSGQGLNGDVTIDNGGNFCVMTPQECRDMSPNAQVEIHSSMCDCSTTRTGACFESGTFEYFCAISEDACNPTTQNFVSAAALADVGEVDCRLCSSGTVTGLKASTSNKQFSTGQIIGITIGACFAFMIVAWLTCFTCRKCCCNKKSSKVPKTVATTAGDAEETATGGAEEDQQRVSAHDAEML
mmetsp:Transcript_194/g.402  ORF Transcript_194/g.402 Transcript_194/m.402 type:complete len:308 (-) Transcript_194:355-1278(-)|eukprot:CAMPEP_0113460984 /NCGR_PEP_ID=MMETSP0014_2-20120614/11289_1 /TAXON_ID=2857 /ORGANISM="Nitzschia sp." /LENGTH=307 /DNA_ID=CAMNT_0000352695 /DNA_START=227 /DNA_END=1150 /DNA_ORIENTATION=- /assembly_acc=CAM_ASM_000159